MIIYKYPLLNAINTFTVPASSGVLYAAVEDHKLFAWIIQDENFKMKTLTVSLIYTGISFENAGKYINTVQFNEHIYHVFAK